jgi:hypothetical protein
MMSEILELLREALPEAIGGLVVAAILSLIAWGIARLRRKETKLAIKSQDGQRLELDIRGELSHEEAAEIAERVRDFTNGK